MSETPDDIARHAPSASAAPGPAAADPMARPAMLLLHGHGEDPARVQPVGRALVAGDGPTLVCPAAPHALGGGGYAWWTDDEEEPAEATIEALAAAVPPGTSSLCIAGFSQGGATALVAAARLAALTPDRPLAVVVVAGFLPGTGVTLPERTPVLVVHGLDDDVVDPFHGELIARRLRRQGCDVTEASHPGGHVWTDEVTARVRAWLRR